MAEAKAAYTKVAAPSRGEQEDIFGGSVFPYLLTVLVLLTFVSLFHVWSRVQLIELNLQVNEANRTLKDSRQEGNRLRLEVAALKNPARVEALAKGELGMVLPSEQQVIAVR